MRHHLYELNCYLVSGGRLWRWCRPPLMGSPEKILTFLHKSVCLFTLEPGQKSEAHYGIPYSPWCSSTWRNGADVAVSQSPAATSRTRKKSMIQIKRMFRIKMVLRWRKFRWRMKNSRNSSHLRGYIKYLTPLMNNDDLYYLSIYQYFTNTVLNIII